MMSQNEKIYIGISNSRCLLRSSYQVWHTQHRSMVNAMTHLVAALAAYTIAPLKLSAIKLLSN